MARASRRLIVGTLVGALAISAPVLAFGAGASRLPIQQGGTVIGNPGCYFAPGTGTATDSFAVIQRGNGTIGAEVSMRGLNPGDHYDVSLVDISPTGPGTNRCIRVPLTTTDPLVVGANGHVNLHIDQVPLPAGTTLVDVQVTDWTTGLGNLASYFTTEAVPAS